MQIQHLSGKLKLFVLMWLMIQPLAVHAENEFVVTSVTTQRDESVYFFNLVQQIELPDYMTRAFEMGFELPLALEVEVYRQRKLWFDKKVVVYKQQFRLQSHAMLDAVSIYNVNAGSRLFFSSLDQALAHLSVIMDYPYLDALAFWR